MPAFSGPVKGRGVQVARGAAGAETLIAGVRVKGVSVGAEAIDVSNDDSGVWAEKLGEPGQVSVTISVSGLAKNHTLLTESLNGVTNVKSTTFTYPGGGKIEGDFFLQNYSENGEYNGAVAFECEFVSTGDVTYTPGV